MIKFNLEAAKRGEPILFDGKPAAFIVHVPGNEPAYRVVISLCGRVRTFTEDGRHTEDGEVCLSMAPRTVRTIGYRRYIRSVAGLARVTVLQEDSDWRPEEVAKQDNFIAWIDHEWQYDEVLL